MKNIAGRPYGDSGLVAFLSRRILELKSRKSQMVIAFEAGFVQATMLANIKRAVNKLPLDRVPSLAKALECDPALLFKLALEQTGGDTTAAAVENIFRLVVTENEVGWVNEIRDASNHMDPRLAAKSRTALRAIFGR